MKSHEGWLGVLIVATSIGMFATAKAGTIAIWTQDFSNVSNWQVISDPGGGFTISSSGGLGLFSVTSGNSEAAFVAVPGVAPMVSFNVANKNNYAMNITVPSLTGSTSYDIRLDQFDANTNYLSTVLGVFPQGTFTGPTNILLGGFTYSNSTAFLLPKITVFTGNPNQTVSFGVMEFTKNVTPPGNLTISRVTTNIRLTYSTISNELYDVQSATNLASGAWSTITSNFAGTGATVTNIDVGAATVPKKFYRVGVQP